MPRTLRAGLGGYVYHVLNRGVGRRTIFRKPDDYAAFIRVIDDVQKKMAVPVSAYCLMPNHWHLVLTPARDGDLSTFMRLLGVTHTQRFHAAHSTAGYGPIYQGRFKSFPVADDAHAATVCRYVERNALRAGLVMRAERWPWSSACTRGRDVPAWLSRTFDWPMPRGDDYRKWLNAPQTAVEEEAIRCSIARGRPYGPPTWATRAVDALGLASTLRPRGRPKRGKDS